MGRAIQTRDDEAAIEVKSSGRIKREHIDGLVALGEEGIFGKKILVCREKERRYLDGEDVSIYPWAEFLEDLWNGEIF